MCAGIDGLLRPSMTDRYNGKFALPLSLVSLFCAFFRFVQWPWSLFEACLTQIDLLGMIRKALKVFDSVLTFRLAILTFQGTEWWHFSHVGDNFIHVGDNFIHVGDNIFMCQMRRVTDLECRWQNWRIEHLEIVTKILCLHTSPTFSPTSQLKLTVK